MKTSYVMAPQRASGMYVAGMLGLVLFTPSHTVHAQVAPPPHALPSTSSGALLQQNQSLLSPDATNKPAQGSAEGNDVSDIAPELEKDSGPKLLVKRFELDETLPEPAAAHVQKLFKSVEARELSYADITRVRILLNAILRNEVDLLAYAVLPDQKVDDGVVRFSIKHGSVEGLSLKNTSLVSDKTLMSYLPARGSDAKAPSLAELEQVAHRIDALSGVDSARIGLAPGEKIGTTDATMVVTSTPRIRGAVLADNSGSPASGANRVGVQAIINSPLGMGDQFQGVALYAPPSHQGREGRGGHTVLGQASYELPLGRDGIRGGVQYSRINYQQGGPYKDIFDPNGFADVTGIYANKPLLQRDNANLTLGGTLDYKKLTDTFFELSSRRSSIVAGAKLSGYKLGELAGRPNAVQFDATLVAGYLKRRELGAFDFDGLTPSGRFGKFVGNVEFSQKIRDGLSASLKGSIQLANRHLDSSEQMGLTGAQAVRGYNSQLSSVDQGAVLSASLTQQINPVPGLQASLFYDQGRGQINKQHALDGAANMITVKSAGLGLSYQYNKKVSINVTYAKRVGAAPLGQAVSDGSQTWVSATMLF
ncbi:MAG: ShlB/FhaC/HecB family hemolysin secretion/activation protein [Rhodanobacter sp.]